MPLAERAAAISTLSTFFFHAVEAMQGTPTNSGSRRPVAGARVTLMMEILLSAMVVQLDLKNQKPLPEANRLDLFRLISLLVALSIAFVCAIYQ